MFLKKRLFSISLLIILIVLVGGGWIYFTQKPKGKTVTVIFKETGFVPQDITIRQGDFITFTTDTGQQFWPASDLHPTHGIYPEFDPQEPIEATESWQFTFNKKGAWKYHDHLNPFFRGTIVVK